MAQICHNVSRIACIYKNSSNITPQSDNTVPTAPNVALRELFMAMVGVNAVVAVAALCFNLLIIGTFVTTSTLRTPRNVLLFGLAISDVSVTVTAQPVFCIHLYSYWHGSPELTNLTDHMFFNSFAFLFMVSLGNLTLITADRYLAIRLHLRYNELVTTKRYCIALLVVWMCSGVATYLRHLEHIIYYLPLIDLFIILVIYVCNVFFFVKITLTVRRHTKQIHAQQSALDMPKYKRSVNTMYLVISVFFLCSIGRVVGLILLVAFQDWNEIVSFVLAPADTIMMLNGVLNPCIYCFRIKDIRNAAKVFVKKVMRL